SSSILPRMLASRSSRGAAAPVSWEGPDPRPIRSSSTCVGCDGSSRSTARRTERPRRPASSWRRWIVVSGRRASPSATIRGLGCLVRMYDDGLAPAVMDFEESFPAPSLPWRSDDGPPALYLGFAGSRELVGACWRVAHRRLRAAAARSLPDGDARDYWRTRH